MNPKAVPQRLSIAVVEQETGLSKDTLRVWERRYGFPQPDRDAQGERVYSPEQLLKLRMIKRLMDQAYRPGALVIQSAEALQALLDHHSDQNQQAALAAASPSAVDPNVMLTLLKAHDIEAVRQQLQHWLLRFGLARFVIEVLAPLNTRIGEAWMQGQLEIFEEHIYSEALQWVLRPAIQGIPAASRNGRPRVLLTTLPGETHGLGLLMVEALLALEGCHCVSLGVQTPPQDIARAAQVQRADVVALSCTGFLAPKLLLEGLSLLRTLLPASRELWAGGASPALRRRAPEGIRPIQRLDGIAQELGRWREAEAQKPPQAPV